MSLSLGENPWTYECIQQACGGKRAREMIGGIFFVCLGTFVFCIGMFTAIYGDVKG
jgi:hypothetical protein